MQCRIVRKPAYAVNMSVFETDTTVFVKVLGI